MPRRVLLPLLLTTVVAGAQDRTDGVPPELALNEKAERVGTLTTPKSAYEAGILALKGERPMEAIDHFTRELAAHPQNGKAWYYRGVCHLGQGDALAAVADLDRALELMPADPNALLRRSEAHVGLGADEAAEADLGTILSAHSTGPIAEHALMSLGELQMRRGDHQQAVSTYDRFVRIAPQDARSWFNRGIAHAHHGAHQLACNDLSKAIVLDGWMYKAYAARAIELVHLGRKPEACADLIKAQELGDEGVADLRAIYCD